MKNAKKTIKQHIKGKAEEGQKLRLEIQTLKWKEGKPPVQRDASGRKVTGKKALKAFKRPETGPQRFGLWDDKRSVGSITRVWLLLLGLLRGRPYRSIEAKVHPWNVMSAKTLHRWLADVLPSEQMTPYNEAAIKAWLDGAPAPKPLPKEIQDQPAKEAPKPPSQRPSLFQRVKANLELWGYTWLKSST
jgi:hypothetical protein